ncbi:lipid-A-disaccharide synthase [uncultured Litoreibacter sp.]|uniref:lipid-A-disaccharide synthase n=1 Tax=uncultured Litoreibacter sp. TaxID=1392394 RepID=UPI00262795DB|nr:lipid-A-disaccharide synthase [uncultured Litoreibacter sp.]
MNVYLIAGEPSGDRLGAALMAGLKTLNPDIGFAGVGGPLMQAEGLDSLFPMEELSVMGLAEVLPKLRRLFKRRDEAANHIVLAKPDALVTIDSPDFCLRVAAKVNSMASDIATVHYVAPTVWAWRPERAAKMAKSIDHVLALFPFEPPYMEAAGMTCDFVGHPVVAEPVASAAEVAEFRRSYGLDDAPVILALPGSRVGEVTRLADRFGDALSEVIAQHPSARIVVPTVGSVAGKVHELVKRWPGVPLVLDPRDLGPEQYAVAKRAAFRAAHVALAASGTVSLELAAAETPMVIAYDMNWMSRRIIASKMLIDTVTLVNIVSGTHAVPEFLGDACKAPDIARALNTLMGDEAARAAQLAACADTMAQLGKGAEAPGLRAARSVYEVIKPAAP